MLHMDQPSPAPAGPDDTPVGSGTAPSEPIDPIDALRVELSSIEARPVAQRVARFEHANAVLAAALAELDEV